MKRFLKQLFAVLGLYAQKALGAQAEFGNQLIIPGFRSNSSYVGAGELRYVFVEATAARQANRVVTAPTTTALLGVMQNDPGIGEAMTIAYAGFSKVVAGAAISANAIITTQSGTGRAATVTSGDMAAGRALEAAGANGDVISAILFHPVRWSGV
jgi:hypothetical protein